MAVGGRIVGFVGVRADAPLSGLAHLAVVRLPLLSPSSASPSNRGSGVQLQAALFRNIENQGSDRESGDYQSRAALPETHLTHISIEVSRSIEALIVLDRGMSRPLESLRAQDRLNARAMLAKAAPALAMLKAALRDEKIDAERVGALLDQAVAQVEANARDLTVASTIAKAHGDDPVAKAITAYDDVVRRDAGIAALASGLDRLRDDARTAQRSALLEVALAAAKDAARPKYMEDFLDQLQTAGLTSVIRRGLSRDQMDSMKEIMGIEKAVRKPKYPTRPVAVEICQPMLSPWKSLVDPVPGYEFRKRPADSADPEDIAILKASLPPMPTIEAYRSGAAVEMANLPTDGAKARLAWKTMKAWLDTNGLADEETRRARSLAWTFLLGHVHGFLTEVRNLDEVIFASPWRVNQVVIATRVE